MDIIYQGETPVITVEISDDISVSDLQVAFITFSQNGAILFEKSISDLQIDTTNNRISYQLSQEETLHMKQGEVLYQFTGRTADGQRIATDKENFALDTSLKNAVI